MKILVTGAKGFVGKNLVAQLNNIKEGKARWYSCPKELEIYEYDVDSSLDDLDRYCCKMLLQHYCSLVYTIYQKH